jgi:hypothetical protein
MDLLLFVSVIVILVVALLVGRWFLVSEYDSSEFDAQLRREFSESEPWLVGLNFNLGFGFGD